MERIQELMGRLADLSDAEIAELEGLILTEFDTAEASEQTIESVERMVNLAESLDTVRQEVTMRNEQAEVLAEKARAAAARVRTPAIAEAAAMEEDEDMAPMEEEPAVEVEVDMEETEMPDEEEETMGAMAKDEEEEETSDEEMLSSDAVEEAELSAESVPETASDQAPTTETELSNETQLSAQEEADDTTPQEDAVTASVENGSGIVVTPPADATPIPSKSDSALGLTITAGADIPGYGTGSTLSSMSSVADAFAKRLHTLRNVQGGSGQQHVVATLAFEYPDNRVLQGDDPSNIAKVNDVIAPSALVASAGVCAPLETIYDVPVCGDTDRPVRDALARFAADRGGVRIYGSPTLAGGVGIWDPSSPTTKSCEDATCPTPDEILLNAVYACVKFSNYTNRFFPEVVQANTDLAMINHARVADLALLAQIATASTEVTPSSVTDLGITRQVLRTLANNAAYLRRTHRLANNAPLRAIFPSWLQDAMRADLATQMPGDGLEALAISEAQINGYLRNIGVNATWSLDSWDDEGAALAPTGTEGFETEVSFALFPEGTFLFLDGGTLDLGVVRDETMLSANEYATFVETFENVAKVGCESLWIKELPVCVSGAAAALIDTGCSVTP